MSEEKYSKSKHEHRGSIFWPLLLVALGVMLLLNTLGYGGPGFWDLLKTYWPLLFVASGLDGLYRREGIVSGVFFAAMGVVFLLGNLGYLQIGAWETILRFWPVMFIIWGFDILLGRRGILSFMAGTLVGLALAAGLFWMMMQTPLSNNVSTENISQPLNEAESAEIYIEEIGGILEMASGTETSVLISGEVEIHEKEELQESISFAENRAIYELSTGERFFYAFSPIGSAERLNWDLKLNREIPLDLDSKVVFGEQTVNLSSLQVESLNSETIFGKSTLILPAEGDLVAEIKVVFGELILYVQEGVLLRVNVDTGLTSVQFPADYTRDGDVILSPQGDNTEQRINLVVDLPIGSLKIKTLD